MSKPPRKAAATAYAALSQHQPLGRWNGMIVYAIAPKTGKIYMNTGGALEHDPASLNKLMVFNLTLAAMNQLQANAGEIIPVDQDAAAKDPANREGKGFKLLAGAQLSVDQMLSALMIASDNGAAMMLGRFLEKKAKNRIDWRIFNTLTATPPDNTRTTPQGFLAAAASAHGAAVPGKPAHAPEAETVPVAEQGGASKRYIIRAMNQAAKQLGMSHTRYINTSGLPSNYDQMIQILPVSSRPAGWDRDTRRNITTAEDMAKLMTHIATHYPEKMLSYMGQSSVTYCDLPKPENAHHDLLKTMPASYKIAAKTGYTNRAKHNITAHITDPENRELIVVVMGAQNMSAEALRRAGLAIEGKGEVRGRYVRDALARQVAFEAFARMREEELAQSRDAAKPQPLPAITPPPRATTSVVVELPPALPQLPVTHISSMEDILLPQARAVMPTPQRTHGAANRHP